MSPSSDPNELLNTQKTIIFLAKQALTRRILWKAGASLGSKIGSVASPGAHRSVAGKAV